MCKAILNFPPAEEIAIVECGFSHRRLLGLCYKLLKDRKGRTLSGEDIAYYGKIVALSEAIRLMAEIDAHIEEHGDFPLIGSQS